MYLTWPRVDLDDGAITVAPTEEWLGPKNGEPRIIPICPEPERTLREAPRHGMHVLTRPDGRSYAMSAGLLNWFKRLYRRAGIADWKSLGIHTLRHAYCSRLT